jgi:hypothetical protein
MSINSETYKSHYEAGYVVDLVKRTEKLLFTG